jgi:ureidoglycolate hydrolase
MSAKVLPEIENLSPEAFAPFGEVLRRDPGAELFQPVFADSVSQGWRVALLEVPPSPLGRIHRHPDSEECFAPLFGEAFLVVAEPESPEVLRCFRLDEPVCVRRTVWHEVISATPARIFIAENAQISGEPRYLEPPLKFDRSSA